MRVTDRKYNDRYTKGNLVQISPSSRRAALLKKLQALQYVEDRAEYIQQDESGSCLLKFGDTRGVLQKSPHSNSSATCHGLVSLVMGEELSGARVEYNKATGHTGE